MFPICMDVEISNPSNPYPPAPTVSQGTSSVSQPPAEKTNTEQKMGPYASCHVPDQPVASSKLPSTPGGGMRLQSVAREINLNFSSL